MSIATSLGWHTGSRSDDTISSVHRPIYLLDVHWTDYDWSHHLRVARAERPVLAVVPDILDPSQVSVALARAEEIAPYCDSVLFVPKCDVIDMLPRCIGNTGVLLGYSIPSRYGGTHLPVWCFAGWPVHLLGGTPLRQLTVAAYLDVVSADGNMAQKLANRGIAFCERGHGIHLDRWEARDGSRDMPTRALTRSLINISNLWRQAGHTIEARP